MRTRVIKTSSLCTWLLAVCLVGGCSWLGSVSAPPLPSMLGGNLTPQQHAYLERARAQPLKFTMPADQADKAWERARDFVEKYCSLPITDADEGLIQTAEPTPSDTDVGYEITRRLLPDNVTVRFFVEPHTASRNSVSAAANKAHHNAHLLAYYIKTGELDPSLVAK